ncbi:hypothetical protein LshimejAT787_0901900 [Lyophyllum shimeji]|uniref:Uncharacterized protein n=1 Tax=Lyophyllum shimeji TaxID=47721 RepID=A0A9P3UR64_LYOSH|nr:hypothetical protein LshimejAT787_0901900 [Lyophyllum shimeji]
MSRGTHHLRTLPPYNGHIHPPKVWDSDEDGVEALKSTKCLSTDQPANQPLPRILSFLARGSGISRRNISVRLLVSSHSTADRGWIYRIWATWQAIDPSTCLTAISGHEVASPPFVSATLDAKVNIVHNLPNNATLWDVMDIWTDLRTMWTHALTRSSHEDSILLYVVYL